jgi:hypothetical protein
MNDESSRSHLIFMIELESKAIGNSASLPTMGGGGLGSGLGNMVSGAVSAVASTFGKSIQKRAKLNLIDLAGSERSKATVPLPQPACWLDQPTPDAATAINSSLRLANLFAPAFS